MDQYLKGEKPLKEKQFAIIGAVIAWAAIILQLYLLLQNRTASVPETLVRFVSFFTILTNLLVAICLTSVIIKWKKGNGFFSAPATLSAATVYILIVGVVYNLVLRSTWNPEGLQKLVDELLHTVIPVYFFLYWFMFVEKERLNGTGLYAWLIYPFLYLVFILTRGALSGFYPYPFVNVTELGYEKVLKNSVILVGVFLLFSYLLVGIAKLHLRMRGPTT